MNRTRLYLIDFQNRLVSKS